MGTGAAETGGDTGAFFLADRERDVALSVGEPGGEEADRAGTSGEGFFLRSARAEDGFVEELGATSGAGFCGRINLGIGGAACGDVRFGAV